MEEFEEEELYDCEIYTNQVIEEQDENEEEFSDNEKNILICPRCGFTFNPDEPPVDYKGRKIDIGDYMMRDLPGYFRCPVCSKIVEYGTISEEEYQIVKKKKQEKEEAKKKKLEKKAEKRRQASLRINTAKFNNSLIDIQKELEEDLKDGKITPVKFMKLYKSLSNKLYKRYNMIFKRNEAYIDPQEFKQITSFVGNNIVSHYTKKNELEAKFEAQEDEIDEELMNNDKRYQELNQKYIETEKIYDESIDEEDFIREENVEKSLKELKYNIKKNEQEKEKAEKAKSDIEHSREKNEKDMTKKEDKMSEKNKDVIKGIKPLNNK